MQLVRIGSARMDDAGLARSCKQANDGIRVPRMLLTTDQDYTGRG